MTFDPSSVGLSGLRIGWEALRHFRNRNEARRFFYELRDAVADSPDLPHAERETLARDLFFLHADPDFRGPLDDYLARDAADGAAAEMRPMISTIVERVLGPENSAQAMEAVMREVHRSANRAKRSDREAEYLQHERTRAEIGGLRTEIRQSAPVVLLTLDWAPDWTQKALKRLGEKAPQELADLKQRVGDGSELGLIRTAIQDPDDALKAASAETWIALSRFAEEHGDWALSCIAMRTAAEKSDNPVDAHVRAALAASLAEDPETYEEQLAAARSIDPEHPRLRLEEIGARGHDDPAGELEDLEPLHFDQPDLSALLDARRALNLLLLEDFEEAETVLDRARAADPELLQVRMVSANLAIHRNRLAVARDLAVDSDEAREAAEACLEIRELLLRQQRWHEAGRSLMLAMDGYAVAGDRRKVRELASQATDGERRVEDEAIAEAALRALQFKTALEVLWPDKTESPARRRIRAQVLSSSDDPASRAEGVAELDRLIDEGGPEAHHAAMLRCMRCAMDSTLEWSEGAEAVATGSEDEGMALTAKAMWHASRREFDEAQALIDSNRGTPWVQDAEFQVAIHISDERAAEVARRLLSEGKLSQSTRTNCAIALEKTLDLDRAKAEFHNVADDDRTPADMRSIAFQHLFTLGIDPAEKLEVLQAWQGACPEHPWVQEAWDELDTQLRG